MKRLMEVMAVLGLVWMCLSLSGCYTVHGLGGDLQSLASPYVQE